jgi:hypothetical protein
MTDLNNVTMNDVLNKAIDGYRPWFPDTVPTHKIAEAVIATLAEHDRQVAEAAWEQGATDYAKYMVAEESYYNGGGVYLSPPDEPVNPHRAKGATDD